MKIDSRDLEKGILIVAEIGNNHEGNFDLACRLIHEAAVCGVDAVKFQTYKTEYYVSSSDKSRFQRLKSFELSYEQFRELSIIAHTLGLAFISTPFDIQSAEFLYEIVDAYKISSGDNSFFPLLEAVCKYQKPIILSTGLSTYTSLKSSISFIKSIWGYHSYMGDLALLHCVSCYPVHEDQANLLSIPFMQTQFPYPIGYSDHTIGIEASVYAAVLGAKIIEKHFTINKNYSLFRDHQLSSDPTEMKELVMRVRHVTRMRGLYEKSIQSCENENRIALNRSCTVITFTAKGTLLALDNVTWTRPGGGIPPGKISEIIGKRVIRDLDAGEQIYSRDVEL